MTSSTTAPGSPPLGLWSKLTSWLSSPAKATGGLEHRVSELELSVAVLQAQVAYAQGQLVQLQTQVSTWGQPRAVLPTDRYLAGKRYSDTGEAYITTVVSGSDRWVGGARVSDQGDQVIVP
jgi:hypothetical protein